jgi:hypothetical protein
MAPHHKRAPVLLTDKIWPRNRLSHIFASENLAFSALTSRLLAAFETHFFRFWGAIALGALLLPIVELTY